MLKKKFLIIVILGLLLVCLVDNFVLASSLPNINDIQVDTSLANSSKIKSASRVTFTVIITCIFGFMLYVIPMFIALKRKHPQRFPIGCLNIFLGWTFIGWVVCLVWALSNTKTEAQNSSNKYNDLAKLQELKEKGTISEEEFESEKQKILK